MLNYQRVSIIPSTNHRIRRQVAFNMAKMDKNTYLVGALKPSEKYEFVKWDDDIPKKKGKIKVMFQSAPTRYAMNAKAARLEMLPEFEGKDFS